MRIGTGSLIATSCGTAIATVCAIGLIAIEQLAPGIYSALAVLCGGALSFLLARRFAHLAKALPSSAGMLAYLSRGLGRRGGLLLSLPYLLLSLFLVGAEATMVGQLIAHVTTLHWTVGALGFLIGTWALCRIGLRLSLRAEALATFALIASLLILSSLSLRSAAMHGQLAARLFVPAPSLGQFIGAVGQALFLFMGFELITSQAESTQAKSLRRALLSSVGILFVFYSTLALGLACVSLPQANGSLIPQLVMAESTGGRVAVILVVLFSLLAAYTSFNGALLSLSRLTAALASQGSLPKSLARIDGRTLLPQGALSILLGFCVAATAIVGWGGMMLPAISSAAAAAALAYAAVSWVREQAPFAEPKRSRFQRLGSHAISALLMLISVGVVVDAGTTRMRIAIVSLLGFSYVTALVMSARPFARALRRQPCQST